MKIFENSIHLNLNHFSAQFMFTCITFCRSFKLILILQICCSDSVRNMISWNRNAIGKNYSFQLHNIQHFFAPINCSNFRWFKENFTKFIEWSKRNSSDFHEKICDISDTNSCNNCWRYWENYSVLISSLYFKQILVIF